MGAWEAHEREFAEGPWSGVKKSVERERERELLGAWTEWKSGERVAGGKGPSPGRREPAGLRASLRHEQARGTSSEAVALRDDAKGSRNSLSVSFMGFCVNACGKAPVGLK